MFLLSLFAPCLAFWWGFGWGLWKSNSTNGTFVGKLLGLGHFGALRVEVEFLSQACTTKTITTPAPAKPFPQNCQRRGKAIAVRRIMLCAVTITAHHSQRPTNIYAFFKNTHQSEQLLLKQEVLLGNLLVKAKSLAVSILSNTSLKKIT